MLIIVTIPFSYRLTVRYPVIHDYRSPFGPVPSEHPKIPSTAIENDTYDELGVDDLDDDLLVGEPDNEPVLRRVVLVLGLGDQSLPGVVVGLSLPSPPRLLTESTSSQVSPPV
jgi:hypothetical protein